MAAITAGVELFLKDKYSKEIGAAGKATQSFSAGAMSAINGIDRALSGTAAKLGAFGLSFGVGAATKQLIDTSAKLTRLGVQAGVSAEEVNKLKQKIYEVATQSNIKVGTDELTAAIDSIVERTGDLDFAKNNLESIAMAIQATGAGGADIGGLFAEFQKMGLGTQEAMQAIDTLNVQGKTGAFTLQNLASLGPRTIAAYTATGRSGEQALREMGAALQVIRMGTGSSEQAATAFEAVMRSLTSPDKQAKLRKLGVEVRDQEGNFRSITDIMQEVVELSDGSTELLGTIFDSEAMRAFNFEIGEFKRTDAVASLKKFNDIVGDGSTIQADSARNAQEMAANLKNLQTSFMRFADANLTKPLSDLNNLLNKLAENPEKIQKIFRTIATGVGAIIAIKGFASLVNMLASAKTLFGKNASISAFGAGSNQILGGTGATPVFVTNWGGQGGAMPQSGTQGNGNQNMSPSINLGSVALLAAAAAAFQAIPKAWSNIQNINNDGSLTGKEKSSKKGGEVGEAAGKILGTSAGTIAGVKLGAAIGTFILPGLGTAIGAGLGGLGGFLLGNWAGSGGRNIGERLGSTFGDIPSVTEVPRNISEEFQHLQSLPPELQPDRFSGSAELEVHVSIDDNKTSVSTNMKNNTTPIKFRETGSVHTSREAGN